MEVFVARQPIFDRMQRVHAYELLFRVGRENVFTEGIDGDVATSTLITDTFLVFGLEALTWGRKAFINFTKNLLIDETATLLPKDQIVVEILEHVRPEKGIISACRKLKDLGYVLALDDFVFQDDYQPLIKLADIIKVDFREADPKDIERIPFELGDGRIKFLAEKVETTEEFKWADRLGYTYFQGFFFSRPVILSRQDIPSHKISYLNMLHEINLQEVDFSHIETIIKRDVAMSYKLLRFINSSFFSFKRTITSIRQALTLLGIAEFRKWFSLLALRGMSDDKPEELLVSCIIRARLCELNAKDTRMTDCAPDLFLMGMFSMIDTFMGRPMEELLERLPLSGETKDALLGKEGRFHDALELVTAYERVDWDIVAVIAEKLTTNVKKVSQNYLSAVEWVNDLLTF